MNEHHEHLHPHPHPEPAAIAAGSPSQSQGSLRLRIRGMDCAEEVAVLKREVGPIVGGEANLAFDVLNAKMTVSGESVDERAVFNAVARTGMTAEPWQDDKSAVGEEGFWERNRRTALTAASSGFLAVAVLVHTVLAGFQAAAGVEEATTSRPPIAVIALYAISILAGVWTVLPKAWIAAKRLRPDMNLLMVIAVAGAIGIGQWLEGATVACLFALSLTLEAWSVGRARQAVAALLKITPTKVRVVDGDHDHMAAPEEVQVGAAFVVRPGERIPLDGKVKDGASDVDQSPITGESAPVPKKTGDPVFAGTINGDGVLTVESTKPASDTTLARITRMVGEAQSKRAPSEQWVESFARYYTPAVMVLALLVLLIPPLAFGAAWSDWLYRSLVLLVIACPCALVISTPVSIVAALAAAAKNGVLIKGGTYVETPARLKAVALDKTGTITSGKPTVVEIVTLSGHTEEELLERVTALEEHSPHPLARAILEYAKSKGVTAKPAADYRVLQGKGAAGKFDGREFWVGSHRYLEERGQETPEVHEKLEALGREGKTVVVVGNEEHVCGFISLADTVRPAAKQAIADLRALGIEHVVMLTGDNRGTAEVIAKEAGVDEIHAELLPADKVTKVEELVSKYAQVAMLGDGVNDAPALGRASLGVAMGAAGTDAAIETADVALMSDDLAKLPWLVRHSRKTLRVIRQNIWFALGVKAVFVVLTFAGHSSMWGAIAADTGASLVVVFNGLRLLRR